MTWNLKAQPDSWTWNRKLHFICCGDFENYDIMIKMRDWKLFSHKKTLKLDPKKRKTRRILSRNTRRSTNKNVVLVIRNIFSQSEIRFFNFAWYMKTSVHQCNLQSVHEYWHMRRRTLSSHEATNKSVVRKEFLKSAVLAFLHFVCFGNQYVVHIYLRWFVLVSFVSIGLQLQWIF